MTTTIPVIVDAMWREGAGQIAIRLVAEADEPLPEFAAGAHVDLHLPGGTIRPYSLASNPADLTHYVLCVKREALSRGGSASVHDRVRVGERLNISVPRSGFHLRDATHHVLVAGGIGITPILAMAETLSAKGETFELHYFASTRAQVAFAPRLARGFAGGTVEFHISAEGRSPRTGLPSSLEHFGEGARLYQCGPAGLMTLVREAALAAGYPADRVHQEAFAAEIAALTAEGGGFEVELGRSGRVFAIPPDRTIAQVLVEAGVDVPLSCEMGICGCCLTRVREGEIDHRDEVTGGVGTEIALCCSRARSPRLVLEM